MILNKIIVKSFIIKLIVIVLTIKKKEINPLDKKVIDNITIGAKIKNLGLQSVVYMCPEQIRITDEVFNSQWNSFESSNNGDNPITITAEEIDFARRKAESETENPQPVENSMPVDLKKDVKSVLEYMDKLLANLPDEKIDEFAKSEHFEVYKKLFTELGLA